MPKITPYIITLCLFFTQRTNAQNLFANSGFEDINICIEYAMPCAPEAWYYIKPTTNPIVNGKMAPRPFYGENVLLVPVHNMFNVKGPRSFVYTMLTCPLIPGEKYQLSFAINTAGRKLYNLDFYFSNKEPATRNFYTDSLKPTFSITEKDIAGGNKKDWQSVFYEFTATGNEQFCMLGNLSARMPYQMIERMNRLGDVFYFIDEIKLVPVNPQPRCAAYDANVKKIYEQNYRHTDFVLVEPEAEKITEPVYIKDTIVVPAVFFETNSAVLRPAFTKLMDSLSQKLVNKKIARIDIIGHTDDVGTSEKNLTLSEARANSVKDYFINRLPQYTDGIFTEGKGETQPIADNATAAGRAKNRRVEIILTLFEKQD